MKGIVAYDSVNGNTKQVAEAMAEELRAEGHEAELIFLKDGGKSPTGDVMFIGSPTRGGKMTKGPDKFIESLDVEFWRTRPVFMFDTVGPLSKDSEKRKHQLELVGGNNKNAASQMRDIAIQRGLQVRPSLMHFAVVGMWGPLAPDALALAKEAAKTVLAGISK
jgi:flavodoxin